MQQKQSLDPLAMLVDQLTNSCNQVQLAEKIGISPQYLSEILHNKRPLSVVVLDYLGIERVVTYQPKQAGTATTVARSRSRQRRG